MFAAVAAAAAAVSLAVCVADGVQGVVSRTERSGVCVSRRCPPRVQRKPVTCMNYVSMPLTCVLSSRPFLSLPHLSVKSMFARLRSVFL